MVSRALPSVCTVYTHSPRAQYTSHATNTLHERHTAYDSLRGRPRGCADPALARRAAEPLAEALQSELEAAADGSSAFPRLLMGMLLTYAGASVLHKTKKVGVVIRDTIVAGDMVKDIFELELVATVAVCQEISFARRFLRAMGEKFDAPTRVLTDSLSGARILNNVKSASRSRAVLWRCAVVQAAILKSVQRKNSKRE